MHTNKIQSYLAKRFLARFKDIDLSDAVFEFKQLSKTEYVELITNMKNSRVQ